MTLHELLDYYLCYKEAFILGMAFGVLLTTVVRGRYGTIY